MVVFGVVLINGFAIAEEAGCHELSYFHWIMFSRVVGKKETIDRPHFQ